MTSYADPKHNDLPMFKYIDKERELIQARHWQSQTLPFLKEYLKDLEIFVKWTPISQYVKDEIGFKIEKIKHLLKEQEPK